MPYDNLCNSDCSNDSDCLNDSNTNFKKLTSDFNKLASIDKLNFFIRYCSSEKDEEFKQIEKILNQVQQKYIDAEINSNIKNFTDILNSYCYYINKLADLSDIEISTSGYCYDKHYKKEIDEKISNAKNIKNQLKNYLNKIDKLCINSSINFVDSNNIKICELVIDCFMYFDFQYCFNRYYYMYSCSEIYEKGDENIDYSLYSIVKNIMFYNEHFNWSNCNFLQNKYQMNYVSFVNLFFKKSCLYKFSIDYDRYNYSVTNEYNESNIFVKSNQPIEKIYFARPYEYFDGDEPSYNYQLGEFTNPRYLSNASEGFDIVKLFSNLNGKKLKSKSIRIIKTKPVTTNANISIDLTKLNYPRAQTTDFLTQKEKEKTNPVVKRFEQLIELRKDLIEKNFIQI